MPQVGNHDRFEQIYINKLREALAPVGQLITYESDRAALDLGLQLYEPVVPGADAELGQVRVWFQAKGIEASTQSAEEVRGAQQVVLRDISIGQIRYWFSHPEPVYLVVYVEALDRFLAQDVRDLVETHGGPRWLAEIAQSQRTTTLKVALSATLERALVAMPRHRSLRLDGPEYRGRPLGHRLDPLRSVLDPFAPSDFEALVERLLKAHDFRPTREIEIASLLDRPIGMASATVGRLYLTYEWTTPLETEFGVGPDSDFRVDARPHSAQGDTLVVVHADVSAAPRHTEATRALVDQLQAEGVERALVFFNASDHEHGLLGGWRMTLEPLVRVPQGLGSLAFNVLMATNIYLEFLDRISWRMVNYR